MSVNGVTSGNRPFTHEEEELMKLDPSTSTVMNKVRNDAGHDGGLKLRGDDRSLREVKDEQKTHGGVAGAVSMTTTAHAGLEMAEIHAVEAFVTKTAPRALGIGAGGIILGSVAELGAGIYHLAEAHAQGKELANTIAKDELHVALLTQLDLPDGYKQGQFERRDTAGRGAQSDVSKMTTQFATKDKPLVAILQLHADRGMNAARDLISSGQSKEDFLKANPKIAEAYASDAAFRDGFDAMVWAKDNQSPEQVKDLCKKLDERDARYSQAHVSFRV